MGKIAGNFESVQHETDDLFLGDNKFKTAVVSVAAGKTLKDGYVLSRNATSGKLEEATSVDAGNAFILAARDDLSNSGESAKDFNVRVLVWGKVKRSAVTLSGTALTDAQADALRASGILAFDVTNTGKADN